jgi:alpha-L-fucosidase 2
MKLPLCLLLVFCALTARSAVQSDIEYGQAGGERLLLDASIPDGPGPFPAVILVHGGGWRAGDKSGGPQKGYMAPMQDPLSQAGFAWFSINYRLTPKFPHPAQIEDLETAIRWVKAHAAQYHVDPKRIALAGESAGGQMVGLAAVRADDSTRVAAVVGFYGLYDFLTPSKALGQPIPSFAKLTTKETQSLDDATLKLLHDVSASSFVKPGLPPFLLLHGTADQGVPYEQSVNFQAKLKAVGVPCELISIQDGPHGMLPWPALAPDFKDRVVAWLKTTLKVPTSR